MAFHPLANLADLYDGFMQVYRVEGRQLLLIQDDGRHYLIENRCPHMDAALHTGKLDRGDIVCRAHGIAFCLRTGAAKGSLADMLEGLRFFEIAYRGNKIGVEL